MKIQFRGGDVYQIFIRLIEEKVEIQFGVYKKAESTKKIREIFDVFASKFKSLLLRINLRA